MRVLEISKTFTFEASHVLPRHPGKCSRLHGHSWVLTVTVRGSVDDKTGFVMDYSDLKAQVQPLIDDLDHRHLGSGGREINLRDDELASCHANNFYPSSENLLWWIGERLHEYGLVWYKLMLNETCTSSCTLFWEDFQR